MPRRPLLLVVEDDNVLRDLYRVTLSLSNFAVHACEDGLDALHYLDQSRPDVIVLDLDLPRVSGTVLYDEIRARRRADRVPIIVVTGVHQIPPLPEAVVLRKPVTPDQLIKAIESTLTRRDREWIYARGKQSILVLRIAFPDPAHGFSCSGPDSCAPNTVVPTSRIAWRCRHRSTASSWKTGTNCWQLIDAAGTTGGPSRAQVPTGAAISPN
jgi:chemosensory pili system protein ChpA (sensor histidine kinase/response regulator)